MQFLQQQQPQIQCYCAPQQQTQAMPPFIQPMPPFMNATPNNTNSSSYQQNPYMPQIAAMFAAANPLAVTTSGCNRPMANNNFPLLMRSQPMTSNCPKQTQQHIPQTNPNMHLPLYRKAMWTQSEDETLKMAVKMNGTKCWSAVAKFVPGRNGKQCRERWSGMLDPDINREAWLPEEDATLVKYHNKFGNKWAEISKYIPGRSRISLRNRWGWILRHSLKKKFSEARKNNNVSAQNNALKDDKCVVDAFAAAASALKSSTLISTPLNSISLHLTSTNSTTINSLTQTSSTLTTPTTTQTTTPISTTMPTVQASCSSVLVDQLIFFEPNNSGPNSNAKERKLISTSVPPLINNLNIGTFNLDNNNKLENIQPSFSPPTLSEHPICDQTNENSICIDNDTENGEVEKMAQKIDLIFSSQPNIHFESQFGSSSSSDDITLQNKSISNDNDVAIINDENIDNNKKINSTNNGDSDQNNAELINHPPAISNVLDVTMNDGKSLISEEVINNELSQQQQWEDISGLSRTPLDKYWCDISSQPWID